MATITNQWLKGFVVRDRPHSPVTVKLSTEVEPNELRRTIGLKHRLILEQTNGSHHIVTLTHEELCQLLTHARSVGTATEIKELRAVLASRLT